MIEGKALGDPVQHVIQPTSKFGIHGYISVKTKGIGWKGNNNTTRSMKNYSPIFSDKFCLKESL